LCKFLRGVFADIYRESADLLARVTGWEVTAEELRTTARRIVTTKKLYNIREGWTPEEDTLPPRFLSQALPSGVAAGASLPQQRLQDMIQAYYAERGWDAQGYVPTSLVQHFGLHDVLNLRDENGTRSVS
jgi:aldehyde:ferredoxin oxidoreductase